MALGLQVLHRKNIVHRDIKINNILVRKGTSGEPRFVIADFGCANMLASSDTVATNRFGTVGYISPEMYQRLPHSCQTDVYSLGALMYALITCKLPFFEDDHEAYKFRLCTERLDLEADKYTARLSPEAKDLLTGMLAKNPATRLTIDEVIAHQWFN